LQENRESDPVSFPLSIPPPSSMLVLEPPSFNQPVPSNLAAFTDSAKYLFLQSYSINHLPAPIKLWRFPPSNSQYWLTNLPFHVDCSSLAPLPPAPKSHSLTANSALALKILLPLLVRSARHLEVAMRFLSRLKMWIERPLSGVCRVLHGSRSGGL
jgi:hypothetical protein